MTTQTESIHYTDSMIVGSISEKNLTSSVDLRGLRCPLPAIRIARVLQNRERRAEILVLVTDAAALEDIPRAALHAGYCCRQVEQLTHFPCATWRLHLTPEEGRGEPA